MVVLDWNLFIVMLGDDQHERSNSEALFTALYAKSAKEW